MELSSPSLRNSYIFSKKKNSYFSGGNLQSQKNPIYSEEISYIPPKKILPTFWDDC